MNRRCGPRMIVTLAGLAAGLTGACGGEEVVVSATLPSTSAVSTLQPATTVGPASGLFGTTTVVPAEPPVSATTTVVEVPLTEVVNPCPGDARLPGEALEFRDLEADLDGDGLADLVRTYAIPMTEGPMRWRARLERAAGGFSEVELTDAVDAAAPLGAVQVDRNATGGIGLADEVLVAVGAVGPVPVQVLTVDELGCLTVMGDGLGAATTLTIGAGDARADGLRCESTDGADYLVQLGAVDAGDGVSYATTDTRLQRVGTNLVPFTVTEGTASVGGEVLPRYSMVDCTGIALPEPG